MVGMLEDVSISKPATAGHPLKTTNTYCTQSALATHKLRSDQANKQASERASERATIGANSYGVFLCVFGLAILLVFYLGVGSMVRYISSCIRGLQYKGGLEFWYFMVCGYGYLVYLVVLFYDS